MSWHLFTVCILLCSSPNNDVLEHASCMLHPEMKLQESETCGTTNDSQFWGHAIQAPINISLTASSDSMLLFVTMLNIIDTTLTIVSSVELVRNWRVAFPDRIHPKVTYVYNRIDALMRRSPTAYFEKAMFSTLARDI